MNTTTTRSLTIALAAIALALATTGTASADTNKNQQTSNIGGPTAALLSPGAGPGDNHQSSDQAMIKRHTHNWAVIDYIETPSPTTIVGL
ncbi:hypothetical protein [Streptomyces poonensis]|uniref:Secreted protein n=1 Tax=Streptomyces poonensis TaxID=68255 RepID=A0A918US55_9ACTN|nr:hypothetical protein [Streptomyces poonensis]GGZ29444.1 hypothetical protein GCM10010365_57230 [Streptomyces poonensis]